MYHTQINSRTKLISPFQAACTSWLIPFASLRCREYMYFANYLYLFCFYNLLTRAFILIFDIHKFISNLQLNSLEYLIL